MKNDEELQLRIERGEFHDQSIDAEAYRQVFSVLKQETNFALPTSFADRMVDRLLREAERKEASRDQLWFILGGVLFLIAFVVSLAVVEFKPGVGVFTFFAGYPGLVLFGGGFILLLHILDRKFIRSIS
jgi:hypothetical protein